MSEPRLSIVVPVYNEERTLAEIIARVQNACPFAQLILVDDGSTDDSQAILRRLARPQDVVLTKPNGGKGSAVRAGYAEAEGRYVIVQDADLEYSPEEIPALLDHAERHDHPALFGSRRLRKQKQFAHLSFYLGGTLLTRICNLLYATRLSDQPTCYKMVRRDVLESLQLREDDFRFDPELTAELALRRIAIAELPISYHPRTVAEGKKICWKDWFRWVWVFVRRRAAGVGHPECRKHALGHDVLAGKGLTEGAQGAG
jgi:glycosyltransferase involved in cell wall biosynthesis